MRDFSEEDPTEVEAGKFNLNFVKLDGNVGCMVNGAGLAMATMDMIKLSGGEPANFLDVGGTANAQTVEAGFKIIMQDPNVKAILINIFGGIVRCDRVASGVIEAYKNLGNINIPIIVRLQGTNAVEAKKLIDESGLKGTSIGGACVSPKHGNFIVNEGGATARDVLQLIGLVRERVRQERGIELETEVMIVGEER
jgi:succinyl-CoA synthetase beta subunit